ncbi:hypothetical protein JCM3770_006695 [Rhodotorula araucariae]
MFSWLSRRTATSQTPDQAPSAASTAPPSRSSSPTRRAPSAGAPADDDARVARNRKKRQQKKKAQRQKRRSDPGALGASGGDRDDDDREPDDDPVLVEEDAPDADEDLGYLDRIGGLRRQREEQAAAAAAAAGASGAGARPPPFSAPRDALAHPGEGALDTAGVAAGREEVEAAALVGEMLRQGKIRAGPTGPLNRISGLPDGAGQINGIEVPSTHEVRKKAKDSGLIPFTDDKGMLRIGVRVASDVVLMHPKDGKGEPILLRM